VSVAQEEEKENGKKEETENEKREREEKGGKREGQEMLLLGFEREEVCFVETKEVTEEGNLRAQYKKKKKKKRRRRSKKRKRMWEIEWFDQQRLTFFLLFLLCYVFENQTFFSAPLL